VVSSAVIEHDREQMPFRHEALLYRTEREFLDGALSFIHEGLAASEPMLVVLPGSKNDKLRRRLGNDAHKVGFDDMETVGANPARIIPAWREFASRYAATGRAFRGIGEPIWAGRSSDELVECQRHEALLNVAFADALGFQLLCPYDSTTLDPEVVLEAHRSHPLILEGPRQRTSTIYRDLDEVVAPFDAPLPEPSDVLVEMTIEAEALGLLRRTVAHYAAEAGLGGAKVHELVFAANEVATNSLVHGGGRGTLRIWRQAPSVVCEVRDDGRITDPLAGRVQPSQGAHGGRGLWLSTQLCDLVQIRTLATGGVVRLHMRVK
jgi:anti-sigma regulatory factor (Ser/Thr protein kinase)